MREWKALRERNTELVNTYKLGDWLIGPDTNQARGVAQGVQGSTHLELTTYFRYATHKCRRVL